MKNVNFQRVYRLKKIDKNLIVFILIFFISITNISLYFIYNYKKNTVNKISNKTMDILDKDTKDKQKKILDNKKIIKKIEEYNSVNTSKDAIKKLDILLKILPESVDIITLDIKEKRIDLIITSDKKEELLSYYSLIKSEFKKDNVLLEDLFIEDGNYKSTIIINVGEEKNE